MPARFLGFCCLLFGVAALFLQPAFAAEPRVALVIGNSGYGPEIGRLLNPANDAKLMADTLKGLGFSVDLVLDADQKAMKRAIKAFGAKLEASGKDTTGLFYYAGHGVQVEGTNFLLPVGAEIEREADVEIESISADDVMTQMQFAGNAVNLVFLDACRNNPLAKANRSGTRGLARLDAPRGSFVGYSTAPGDVAADGDGANSPYALALAEELKKSGISIEEAHRNVRAKVLAQSGNQQTPWDSSSLTGPVVLLEKAVPAPQPVAEPVPAPQPAATQQASVDKEALFWDSIKGSTDPGDFKAYLEQFPQGTFAPLARNRVAALTAPQQPAVPQSAPQQAAVSSAAQAGDQAGAGQSGATTRILVTGEVKGKIDKYISNCSDQGSKRCYIAVSRDGTSVGIGKWDSMWSQYEVEGKRAAMSGCGGADACQIVFKGNALLPGIEIVTQSQEASLPSAQVEQPAAEEQVPSASGGQTQGNVLVTSDVMAQIDGYLKSATGKAGKFNAFAIARDGTVAGHFTCSTSYCPGGSNSNRQEIANKQAINSCGGYSKCILLYEGDRNVANLTPVVQ
jgi:uncharacterized caspase-like protein